ncbi:hypothetical protein H5410_059600 [Solanum commersonii]|uniref:Uncharacterized protein n=1 Tax=Solanum commersonii TaxID=4109 RepID=A0A9J5W2Y8_SOLCO|nr:hypothetical protein H5410_059600 [Solanum commersonii]
MSYGSSNITSSTGAQGLSLFTPEQYSQILQMLSKGNEVDTVANIATTNTSDTLTALMSEMVNCNWIIDTGASNHMVHNIGLMTQCTDLGDKNNKKVNLHTGGQVPISHIGDSLVLKDKILYAVLAFGIRDLGIPLLRFSVE